MKSQFGKRRGILVDFLWTASEALASYLTIYSYLHSNSNLLQREAFTLGLGTPKTCGISSKPNRNPTCVANVVVGSRCSSCSFSSHRHRSRHRYLAPSLPLGFGSSNYRATPHLRRANPGAGVPGHCQPDGRQQPDCVLHRRIFGFRLAISRGLVASTAQGPRHIC